MALIKCKNCGREISDEGLYCTYCGALITKSASEENVLFGGKKINRCDICGFCFNEESFCPRCGWKVGTEDSVENRIKRIPDFDKNLYGSILLPKKPSFLSHFLLLLCVAIIIGCLLSFLIPSPFTLLTIPIVAFLIYKFIAKEAYEDDVKAWKGKKENFDKYRLNKYFEIKSKEEKEQKINVFRKIPSQVTFYEDPLKRNNARAVPTVAYVANSKNQKIIVIYENNNYKEIPFENIIGCQVSENKSISSSIGRAIVGGIIAGETGAIIGATNKPEIVSSYMVSIFLNTIDEPKYDIELIKKPIPRNHIAYGEALKFSNYVHASIESILSNSEK